ncbi:MAG: VCBS repeat-containing protein [Polaromonas sp.]|nr:VCBS repeat-containing protein [Polaromonas sp.]
MPQRIAFAAILAAFAAGAFAESITGAHYTTPSTRYGHFALGRPHEYAKLTTITDAGRKLVFELPDNEVFEDLAPRIVRLSADTPTELLAIVSRHGAGSRLMLIGLRGGGLETTAQSPAIGTPMRWLNPVAVADLDGDGQAEIAAVIMPHIGGTLKVYKRRGAALVEIAAQAGFSNHVYGSAELALSAPIVIAGTTHLLVPDTTRLNLRIVGLKGGRLIEAGVCALPEPLTGALTVVSLSQIAIEQGPGRRLTVPDDCVK